MSDSLTTLIGKVQNLLGDASATVFTTAICTAAIRQALSEFNTRVPQHAAVTITGVNDQYEYELTDEDANAVKILDVLREGDNQDELDISLTYDDYIEDERVFFRLRSPVTTSETLIVRYTLNHTINGLDSQVESTTRAEHDQILVNGGAAWAIWTRGVARVETINLSQDQSDNYREMATRLYSAFEKGMDNAARRQAPVGEPDQRTWQDQYHYWDQ